MPNPDVVIIQTLVEGSDPPGNDAEVMTFEEWWEVWGDAGPAPASKRELDIWWDRLDEQADLQLCNRYGKGL